MKISKAAIGLAVLGAAGVGVAAGFLWSGRYNVGADDAHTAPVLALMQTARERSIAHHAATIKVPDLSDPAMVRQGAGNYAAMCTGCHLAPGMGPTELSRGLYPAPPVLAEARANPAHQFWVIKHGIKASGMPAWGHSMADEYIWGMVAFLQALPALDEAEYAALVASSDGHAHGGGESGGHAHAPAPDGAGPSAAGSAHVHADGKTHLHAPATPPHASPAVSASKAVVPAPVPAARVAKPAAVQAPRPLPTEAPPPHEDHGDHHDGH